MTHGLHLLRLAEGFLSPHQLDGAFRYALFQRLVERPQGRGRTVALPFDGPSLLNVEKHAGEPEWRPVRAMVDPTVRLDPVVLPVGAPHAVLVRVGPAARDRLLDGGGEIGLVVRVDSVNGYAR